MPMTQDDIRRHYEGAWKQQSDRAADRTDLSYSNPVEDAVLYPIYHQLITDLKIAANGGRVLDVGSGSGRWIRFFLDHYRPALLMGIDYTDASVGLLKRWHQDQLAGPVRFEVVDITAAGLELGERFDLINIANVLFHIPEADRFERALGNLASHLSPDGRIVTTEYLPRASMRTDWMLVRSRYEFQAAVQRAGLRICDIRAFGCFANDPMGLDGIDGGTRTRFQQVRARMNAVLNLPSDPGARAFFIELFTDIERAFLGFCRERIADLDLPSQKLVVLGR